MDATPTAHPLVSHAAAAQLGLLPVRSGPGLTAAAHARVVRLEVLSAASRACPELVHQRRPLLTRYLDLVPVARDYSPAIRARVSRAHDDRFSALYEFVIWERLTLYAAVRGEDRPGS